jgi:hypothetical protein
VLGNACFCLNAVILMRSCTSLIGRTFVVLAVLLGAFGLKAGASATLPLEEPYGKLGFFAATGHAGCISVRRLPKHPSSFAGVLPENRVLC